MRCSALVVLAAVAVAAPFVASCEHVAGRITHASSSLYVRADDDETTIVSPRGRVAGKLGDALSLETSYAMDAWTSASIDIRTSASQAVHELRHEVNAGAGYELDTLKLDARYRYSTEPDYGSHGGVANAAIDLAERNTTLALSAFGSGDTVGRAGDPGFRQAVGSLGGRFTLTQVLDAQSVVQAFWETTRVSGFQSSPYRFVALGGDSASPSNCASDAPFCIAEAVPDERYRHALRLQVRRALGPRVSLGMTYRFYADSWGIRSQLLQPDLAWLLTERATLSFEYRYYTQGDAVFYRERYLDAQGIDGFATRDRKLSAFYVHRAGVSYVYEIRVDEDTALMLALNGGITRYRYLAFAGLTQVNAFEVTSLVGLELE